MNAFSVVNPKSPRQLFVEQANAFLWQTNRADWKADAHELAHLLRNALRKNKQSAEVSAANASMQRAQEATTQQKAKNCVQAVLSRLPK